MSTNKPSLRQLAVEAKELSIIKRYTKGIEAQKKFIAAANPATVLALLDELEAAEQTSAARLEAIDRTHKMFQRERDRAEAAEKYAKERDAENEELMLTVGRLRVEREAAEKVSADYRARLDRLERKCDHQNRVYWDASNVKRCARCGISVAAGITVKGE